MTFVEILPYLEEVSQLIAEALNETQEYVEQDVSTEIVLKHVDEVYRREIAESAARR